MEAYIGAGSNLGDRRGHLQAELAGLRREGLEPARISSLWETEPVDAPGSPPFLNLVLRVDTRWEPERVLGSLQRVERDGGRRRGERNAPRRIDLDLLVHGNHRIRGPRLTLPHPRMWNRRFVLAPLAEIAPTLRDPATGRTVARLLNELPEVPGVCRVGVLPALPPSSYNPWPGST